MSDYVPYVSHIMWQPVFHCQAGCRSCYVQASPSAVYDGPLRTEVLDLIYRSKRVACSQFTVSLDTANLTQDKFQPLIAALRGLWDLYNNTDDVYPDLCVTAFNWKTIIMWAKAMKLTVQEFLAPLHIVSLSNFPAQDEACQDIQILCKEANAILNFNYMVSDKAWQMGTEYADQIYLVLRKASLGHNQDVDAFKQWLRTRKAIREQYAEKLVEDVCVMDSLHYRKTNNMCGAGTQKIHIWPDGKVSACPYDSGHVHRPSHFPAMFDEIAAAIQSKTCHAMSFCTIPNMMEG